MIDTDGKSPHLDLAHYELNIDHENEDKYCKYCGYEKETPTDTCENPDCVS